MSRARAGFLYFGAVGLYYSTAFGFSFALGLGLGIGVAVVIAILLVAAMTVVTFLFLQYEEDWWNDFRDQHRGLLLGVIGNLLSVGCGLWLGLSS